MKKKSHRRFKAVLLLLCIFFFLPSFDGWAEEPGRSPDGLHETAYISPEIAASLIDEPGEPVKVLVVLKEQADTPKIANMAGRLLPESLRATIDHRQMKSLSRRAVVNSLLDVADRTQRPLLNHLSLEKLLGHVRDFKSFYIVNMLYLEAHPTIITALSRNPAVKSILPNIVFELQESSPAEVIIPAEEIEPSAASIEWNIKKIRADEVWDSFGVTGEGVVVGIIDSGVYWQHPALKEKFRGYNPAAPNTPDSEYNWFDAELGTPDPIDCLTTSHGTHVTGTIVASTATNIYGVAPGARWIAANAFKSTTGSAESSKILAAAEYMLAPTNKNGEQPNPDMAPDILNCSWGSEPDKDKKQEADEWFRPMVQNLRSAGILPVFAAGNTSSGALPRSVHSPAMYPESFAVGAVDNQNKRATFSNRGPVVHYPDIFKPDICAPGVGIYSTIKNGSYGSKDGTSMATPHIVGVAALLLSYKPTLTVDELEDIIKSTAVPLTDNTYINSPNYGYGYGLADAFAALGVLNLIKDPRLEEAIRESLEEPPEFITIPDLEGLTQLNAAGRNIKYLDGLEYAINLESLDLSDNDITDIAPLVTNSSENESLGKDGNTVDLRNNYLDLREGRKAREDIDTLIANEVNVQYNPQKSLVLEKMSPPSWDGRKIKWETVDLADRYKMTLYKDNAEKSSVEVNALTAYNLTEKIDQYGPGCYTATIQAVGDNDPWISGEPSDHSAGLTIIDIPDANLKAYLETLLRIDKGGISTVDMAKLRQLNYTDTEKKIIDITGLEHAVNLDYIKLSGQDIGKIGPLAGLTQLKYLNLDNNRITNISPLIINSNAGGFKKTDDRTPEISLSYNYLDLDPGGQTMSYIDTLKQRGIKVTYSPQKDDNIAVQSVSLNHSSINMVKGDTIVLNVSVYPPHASNKNVVWSSSDAGVAKVNQYGVVEAVGDGTAIISVISEDGGHEAESTVNVIPAAGENDPLEVSFHEPFHEPFTHERDVPINTGMTIVFNKNIVPDSNYDQITLKNIDRPDQSIGLTKEIEDRKIFLTPAEKLEYNAVYKLTLPAGSVKDSRGNQNTALNFSFKTSPQPIFVESVSLNATHLKLFCCGATAILVPVLEPEEASEWECRWESSDASVATVTGDRAGNGIITPLEKTGTTRITAVIYDHDCEYEAFCNVETIKFGDVTGDGKIEVADAIKVLKDIVGIETLSGPQSYAGRVTGGETVSVSDAILILQHIVGIIDSFPAEAEISR